MKKFRFFLSLFLVAYICFPTALTAYAHPGRTDGNGGHTDHSTGDYHYHHGYEAHDHYDLDGDGDLDCPYDFKDQTNRDNSSNSSNNTRNYSSDRSSNTSNKKQTTVIEKIEDILTTIGIIILILLSFLGMLGEYVMRRRRRPKPAFSIKKLWDSDEFWTTFIIVACSISAIILSILIFRPR